MRKALPERGRIAIFNRSYYEELTVVRVHQSLLTRERIPSMTEGSIIWNDRYEDIVSFARHLIRNGTLILKFFLHLSQDEQRKRFLERIDMPEKNWKMSAADMHERTFWDTYQHAYEKLLTHTSTDAAPWYIIPADCKWFSRAAIADILVTRLKALALAYPSVSDTQRLELAAERKQLTRPVIPMNHGECSIPSASMSQMRADGAFDVYYGAADHVIAVARLTIPKTLPVSIPR